MVQSPQRVALAAEHRELMVAFGGRERPAPLRMRRVVSAQHVEGLQSDGISIVLSDTHLPEGAAANALPHSNSLKRNMVWRGRLLSSAGALHCSPCVSNAADPARAPLPPRAAALATLPAVMLMLIKSCACARARACDATGE